MFINPNSGGTIMVKAWVVTAFGGMGSIRGGLYAAFIIGMVEAFVGWMFGMSYGIIALFVLLLATLAWVLLVIAAARPQFIGEPLQLPVSGRDLILAVDLSGSMQIEDFSINGQTVDRLTATKKVAERFIEQRKGDRLGTIIDHYGVAIRTGHHCTMPLMQFYGVPATARASFGMYNTVEEVDVFIDALLKARDMF